MNIILFESEYYWLLCVFLVFIENKKIINIDM